MSRDDVIASICRLPVDALGSNVSILELLRQSGYSESSGISEQDIEAYLRRHPELIEPWILHSENQRSSTGWWITEPLNHDVLTSDWFRSNTDAGRNAYLDLHAEGKWTVGDSASTVRRTFDDKFQAFAFLVSRRVKQLSEIARP